MKKILIIVTMLMFSLTGYGQEYNRWAIEGEVGGNRVNDEAASSDVGGLHLGLGLRYNINETVGIGLTGSADTEKLTNDFTGIITNLDYYRLNLEGYIDALNIVDLNNQYVSVLFHGGPGVSLIETDSGYDQFLMNVRGGATALFKLHRRWALKADFTTTANLNNLYSLDGYEENTNTGITSTLHNYSVGVVFYFGKKGDNNSKRCHADWYEKEVDSIIPSITNITNNVTPTVTNIIEQPCQCENLMAEYVFFDHDKHFIRQTELNAIYKTYKALIDNPDSRLVISGFASPTSSSNEYNLALSGRRTAELEKKFLRMGIAQTRITTGYYGKDRNYPTEFVHDVARRVELLVE